MLDRRVDHRIHNSEISCKQKHGSNHDAGGGADLLPTRPGNPPHLSFDLIHVGLRLLRPTARLTQFHLKTLTRNFDKLDCLPIGKRANRRTLAGAEGFEPPKAVLETAGLPLAYAPVSDYSVRLPNCTNCD